MARFWKAPELWPNETFFIVGGGPSLKGVDLSGLRDRKTIAVNNAFRIVPDPDYIFYSDTRWWRWNSPDIPLETPSRIVSTCSASGVYLDPRVLRMNRDYRYDPESRTPEYFNPLAEERDHLSGPDSGYMAINLAYHFGASRIVLLGFDMGFDPKTGEAHWHEDHPVETPEENYTKRFLPTYQPLYERLQKRGVEVVRCTPSRLSFIPEVPLDEALALPNRQRG